MMMNVSVNTLRDAVKTAVEQLFPQSVVTDEDPEQLDPPADFTAVFASVDFTTLVGMFSARLSNPSLH